MKKTLIALVLFFCFSPVYAEDINLAAKGAVLVERTTGTVMYEKNADMPLPMASVTKTMTMLLAIEEVDKGKIKLDDVVTVSDKASSMTGSRVYLSNNEKITVDELFKSIAVSSGNDAAVAMAEYICGTEEQFVDMMNKRAEELGLKNTHFMNCYGLDAEGHYSSARDLAVISSELLSHEGVRKYLTIWMDSIRNGSFTLSNTNKLVRFYEGCTGVKTGFTSQAMYCLSASALRNDMELIAVVLGSHNSKARFADASGLLNYGFSNYKIQKCISENEEFGQLPVEKGKKDFVRMVASEDLNTVVLSSDNSEIEKKISNPKKIKAPVKKGYIVGKVTLMSNGEKIGEINLKSADNAEKCSILYIFNNLIGKLVRL